MGFALSIFTFMDNVSRFYPFTPHEVYKLNELHDELQVPGALIRVLRDPGAPSRTQRAQSAATPAEESPVYRRYRSAYSASSRA